VFFSSGKRFQAFLLAEFRIKQSQRKRESKQFQIAKRYLMELAGSIPLSTSNWYDCWKILFRRNWKIRISLSSLISHSDLDGISLLILSTLL